MVRLTHPAMILGMLLLALTAWAAPYDAPPTWDRENALALAASVDTANARRDLMGLTLSGDADATVALLDRTAVRDDWPLPARERALMDYTQSLRGLPSDAVPLKVMQWLGRYQPETLVPHDDHPASAVPLFNIRGAARGVENNWRQTEAAIEGRALLASNPRSLVDAFALEDHPAARQGYVLALQQASREQLVDVSQVATQRLAGLPELTGLGGRAALIAGDVPQLQKVLVQGSGPELGPLMRESAANLSDEDTLRLLRATVTRGATTNAALALAELAPVTLSQAGTRKLVMRQLAHPELGSAAALTLARHATPEVVDGLVDLVAANQDPLGTARAQLALDLARQYHGKGVQQ